MMEKRETAQLEFRRMLKWIAVCGIIMTVGALYYLSLFGEMNAVTVSATILGVFLSVLLGCGLFAAAFYSRNSGHDDDVTGATRSDHTP
jgi:uncharacterized membrane protein